MKTIAALIATAALLMPPPAFAGGPVAVAEEPVIVPAAEPYVAPGLDWSGAYVGGSWAMATSIRTARTWTAMAGLAVSMPAIAGTWAMGRRGRTVLGQVHDRPGHTSRATSLTASLR
jgi:hypothetical protein